MQPNKPYAEDVVSLRKNYDRLTKEYEGLESDFIKQSDDWDRIREKCKKDLKENNDLKLENEELKKQLQSQTVAELSIPQTFTLTPDSHVTNIKLEELNKIIEQQKQELERANETIVQQNELLLLKEHQYSILENKISKSDESKMVEKIDENQSNVSEALVLELRSRNEELETFFQVLRTQNEELRQTTTQQIRIIEDRKKIHQFEVIEKNTEIEELQKQLRYLLDQIKVGKDNKEISMESEEKVNSMNMMESEYIMTNNAEKEDRPKLFDWVLTNSVISNE